MNVILGSIVGNWLVISEKFKKDKIYQHTCECICGTKRDIGAWRLNHKKTLSCGCTNTKGRFRYQGIGDLSKAYLTSFKFSRVNKGIDFSDEITLEYLWDLFNEQNKKCALSGLNIILLPNWSSYNNGKIKDKTLSQTASIDRIDNNKGYLIGNVQWVHKDVNYMRGALTVSDFIFMCNQITNNNVLSEINNFEGKKRYFGSTGK